MNIEPLKKEFKKGKYIYSEERREDDLAIYRVSRKDKSIFAYEVFKVYSEEKETEYYGKKIPPHEEYPTSSIFGIRNAYFCVGIDSANKRFQELQEKKLAKEQKENQPKVISAEKPQVENIEEISDVPKKKRGRAIIWKECKNCKSPMKTGDFMKFKGLCETCRKI